MTIMDNFLFTSVLAFASFLFGLLCAWISGRSQSRLWYRFWIGIWVVSIINMAFCLGLLCYWEQS
jgi:hypothetical protein